MYRELYAPEDRQSNESNECHVILQPDDGVGSDTILQITDNLASALQRLSLADLGYSKPGADGSPQYIWIDALCIDQSNVAEKNVQVAQMDKIYEDAAKVVVFLGDEDIHSASALHMMNILAQLPESAWRGAEKQHRFDDADPGSAYVSLKEASAALGLPHFEPYEWLAYGAFLMRVWFGRIWVVQERFFASEMLVMLGGETIDWEDMCRASAVLFETGMVSSLQGQQLYAIYGTDLYIKESARQEMFGDRLKNQQAFEVLNRKRSKHISLETLLCYSKSFDATNPLDHFYGILGIWKKMQEVHGGGGKAMSIRPEYDSRIDEVYADATMKAVEECGSLAILALVEDKSKRQPILVEDNSEQHPILTLVEDKSKLQPLEKFISENGKTCTKTILPSWVPDYNHRPRMRALAPWPRQGANAEIPRRWNASKGLSYTFADSQKRGGRLVLPVQGIEIDKVGRTGPTFIGLDRGWRLPDLLQLLRDGDANPGYYGRDSLYGAFCRTLVKDTLYQKPLDDEMMPKILSYLVAYFYIFMEEKLKVIKSDMEGMEETDPDMPEYKMALSSLSCRHEETPKMVAELAEKVPGMPSWEEIRNIQARLEGRAEKKENGNSGDNEVETQPEQPDDDPKDDEAEPAVVRDEEAKPEDRVRQDITSAFWAAYSGRKAFRTTGKGLFGIAGESLEEGDGVWIVAGVETPLVLRSCGENNEYELVGEAYVDGIMNGEAVTNGGGRPPQHREILLV